MSDRSVLIHAVRTATLLITILYLYLLVVKPGENILGFVDAVIDSSRYYVVRIKDPKSIRTTLIGIGFREREDAFDLKNSLNEYVKFINRMNLASQLASTPFSDDRMNTKEEGSMLSADVDGGNGEYLSCHSENQVSNILQL